ncbi:MAG: AMP-binding protein [Spirochaetaceae bacterium]|jgi:long-chain acyl-CoA synthetase|nr:AMP-binding protein [Spirochaetaceae bacterium]
MAETRWAFLEEYRGKAFRGQWPTLAETFRITVSRYGDRPCFTAYDPDRISLNYRDALARVEAVARGLRAQGIRKGDTVALTGKNSPEWAVAYLGILFAGAVVTPIDYQLKNEEISLLLKKSKAKILFIDEEKYQYYADLFSGQESSSQEKTSRPENFSISSEKPTEKYLEKKNSPEFSSTEKYLEKKSARENAPLLRENAPLLKEENLKEEKRKIFSLKKGIGEYLYDLDGPQMEIEQAEENDLAAILFTSGTTGNPKGVTLTHRNLIADCYLAQDYLKLYPTDVFYALLPIHHAYTMLAVFIEAISVGAEVVFGKRMVTQTILKELKEAKITMLLGVPMLFNKLLAGIIRGVKAKGPIVYRLISLLMAISGLIKKTFNVNPGKKMFAPILAQASLSTLRICICGGGPLAPEVFRKYNQLGIDFIQGYGLTETSPIIALNPVEHYKETSVGKVLPQTDMKVLDPDAGGVGEIAVKGPMVMQGYYEMPAETAAVFTQDGYLKTGDLGWLDSEKYLYLTGRVKNMIVTEGGKNVYPEEIENEFQFFEEIDQILVRGFIADKKRKIEGVEALVFPNPDFFKDSEPKPRIERIIAEVNQRLLPYQKIGRFVILPERMEETTTKKIKRPET